MTTGMLAPVGIDNIRSEFNRPVMNQNNVSTESAVSEQTSLDGLWAEAEPLVKGFLLAALPQACDAEDVLQEVALETARRFDDYDPSRPFPPWALWIAKIKTADFFRRTYRDRHLLVGDALEPLAEAACRASMNLEEQSDALTECLKSLSPKNQKLIALRYGEGMSPGDIAEKLETSSGTVRVVLHRIRTALGRCIESRLQREEVR